MTTRILLALAMMSTIGACAADDGDGPGPGVSSGSGDGQPDTSVGGVAVSVVEAHVVFDAGRYQPSSGKKLITVTVELSNTASEAPVSTAWLLFSMQTADALVRQASTYTTRLEDFCSTSTSVARGGKVRCNVLFELGQSESLSRVLFDDKQGRSAGTSILTVQEPSVCEMAVSRQGGADCIPCATQKCASEWQTMDTACAAASSCECDFEMGITAYCECDEQCSSASCNAASNALWTCQYVSKCAVECQ